MKRSLLKVKDYFVTDLSIKANPLGEGAQLPAEGTSNIITKIETAQHSENKRDWKVAIQIKCEPIEKNIGGYLISIELVGFFEVGNELPEDRINDVVVANAPAILYGAARELIMLLTGRGPYPPFSLPSATFIDETPSAQKKLAEEQALLRAKTEALPATV